MQPDDDVTKRYLEMAREEPGAAMDAAILEASRRALRPSVSRRWGAPVSIAAVLVLAFGLTLEMRHEEPGIENAVPARPAPPPEAPASAESRIAAPDARQPLSVEPKPVAPPAKLRKESPREEYKRAMPVDKVQEQADEPARAEREAPIAFPASPPPPSLQSSPAAAAAPAPQRAPMQDMNVAPALAARAKINAAGAAALRVAPAAPAAQAESASDPATRELERIAEMRAAARDADADKALEDFRRDHPGYRIPDAMWERVKPR